MVEKEGKIFIAPDLINKAPSEHLGSASGRKLIFKVMREEMKKISPISGFDCERLFSHEVLGKYKANYYYDKSIDYILSMSLFG